MSARADYELLDFGGGRKLERFGAQSLDRPSPAAEGAARQRPELWAAADARFEREGRGSWLLRREIGAPWTVRFGRVALSLRLTDFGHLGLFPEQIENWPWIGAQIERAGRPLEVLNLFAYTGGSTLAAAAAGARVTHVDSAVNTVAWARRNAELSELGGAPIRWISEEAGKFVRRELKRGRQYDAVLLDPPGYGHGPKGEGWKLEEQLGELLASCEELTRDRRQFMLLTCHTGKLASAAGLLECLSERMPTLRRAGRLEAREMSLVSATGGTLNAGAVVRWTASKTTDDSPTPPAPLPQGERGGSVMTAKMITSLQNQRVKDAAKLRDRRQRDAQRRFVIDGAREILRAIGAEIRLDEVFVCEELCHSADSREAAAAVGASGATLWQVTPEVLAKLAFGERHEGVLAVAKTPARRLDQLSVPKASLVAVLEGIEKPGNVGAVLRSADGAGVAAVIVADPATDLFNPNCIRASLGTIFSLPVAEATGAETIAWLKKRESMIYATRPDAMLTYSDVDYRAETAIVLGSEAAGLSDAWRDAGATPIKLPMQGAGDSLNVSAAAAVVFYEALRQRR